MREHRLNHRLTWLSLPLLVSLSGCVSIDRTPYPSSWPQLLPTDTPCTALNGTYQVAASRSTYPDRWQQQGLALMLLPPAEVTKSVKSLSLELQPGHALQVIAYGPAGQTLGRHTYGQGSGVYQCKQGRLLIWPERLPGVKRAPDNPVVGLALREVSLRKATDGSLVIRDSGSVTGMALLMVPVHAEGVHWYLFPAAVR